MSFWDKVQKVGKGVANAATFGTAGVAMGDSWGDSLASGFTGGYSEIIGGTRSDKEREAREKMQQARMGLEQDLQRGQQEAERYGLNAGQIGEGMNRSIIGLEGIVNGDSVAANRMRSSGEQRIRETRGSGQANAKDLERQQRRNLDRDMAALRTQEKMSGLSQLFNMRQGQLKNARGIQGQIAGLGQLSRKELTPEASGLGGLLTDIV